MSDRIEQERYVDPQLAATRALSAESRCWSAIRIQYAQPIGPNIRFHIMKNSQWLAENHAHEDLHAVPIGHNAEPVASITLAMLSRWRSVTRSSMW